MIGSRQLLLLMKLGNPALRLLAPIDRVARSLERRGLLDGGRITPAGLRELAAAVEDGRVARVLPPTSPNCTNETPAND